MNLGMFSKRTHLKAVYGLKVDFRGGIKKDYGELREGENYFLPHYRNKEVETSYLEIKSYLIKAVEEDLQPFLSKTTDIKILDLKLTGSYNGSIELVFTILFNSYQFIAGLKDFYDNLRLIRSQTNRFIRQRLESKYGEIFDVSTNIEYPSTDSHDDLFWMMHKGGIPIKLHDSGNQKRDGLFYYLLVSNIILLSIVGLLVFKAVKSYYGF